jgi:hypothetical protein
MNTQTSVTENKKAYQQMIALEVRKMFSKLSNNKSLDAVKKAAIKKYPFNAEVDYAKF